MSDPLVVGLHAVRPVGNVSYVFSLTNKELSLEELMGKKRKRKCPLSYSEPRHKTESLDHIMLFVVSLVLENEGEGAGLDVALTSAYIILLKELKSNIYIRN